MVGGSEHTQQLEAAQARLAEEGVVAVPAPAHGDPVEAILEIADKVDADIIVLGSHERARSRVRGRPVFRSR
jgi:nucleotide-binding universal stress UspA family protein